MKKVANDRSSQEIVKTGLRILAKLIARQAIKERLAETDTVQPDLSFADTVSAEVSK